MEKLAVPFRVSADVNAIVLRNIQNQLRTRGIYLGRVR